MKTGIMAAASLMLASAAIGQMPPQAPVPDLARAQKAAQAAIKACKGTPIAVAVIDSAALPRLILVGDGANSRMADFARRKATTALRFGKPSAAVRDEAKGNADLAAQLKSDPALIGFGGGLLFAKGAVAVAGAPSQDTDARCAEAAKAVLDR